MWPLTQDTPKSLLKVAGRPILEHIFENLPEEVSEVVVVVGYLGQQIRSYFGNEFLGRRIYYAAQEVNRERYGTWVALLAAKPFLGGEKFLLLYGDDIIDCESIKRSLKHDLAVLVKEVPDPRRFGVVVADESGRILEFVEKPENPPSRLANTGVNVLDERVFNYPAPRHANGEFYLVDSVAEMAKDYPVYIEHADFWFPIATPEDLKRVDESLKALSRKV